MFRIQISIHQEYYNFLSKKNVPKNGDTFEFLHSRHFVDLTSIFATAYIVQNEVNKMVQDEMVSNEEQSMLIACIDENFLKEIEFFAFHSLYPVIENQTYFSIDQFINFTMGDIQKQIRSLFLESLPYLAEKNTEILLGDEKEDVLYMIVSSNGFVTIEKKDCTQISGNPYDQQEQSIAEILYLNPSLLIVYDAMRLLKPELVICLKKFLRKKVVFLEEEHPIHKNRKK